IKSSNYIRITRIMEGSNTDSDTESIVESDKDELNNAIQIAENLGQLEVSLKELSIKSFDCSQFKEHKIIGQGGTAIVVSRQIDSVKLQDICFDDLQNLYNEIEGLFD
ncbi:45463_t:CDS:2, partial [Gigaspora margarita]